MSTDPRMTGLAQTVVATVHAGARALRDGDPRRADVAAAAPGVGVVAEQPLLRQTDQVSAKDFIRILQ